MALGKRANVWFLQFPSGLDYLSSKTDRSHVFLTTFFPIIWTPNLTVSDLRRLRLLSYMAWNTLQVCGTDCRWQCSSERGNSRLFICSRRLIHRVYSFTAPWRFEPNKSHITELDTPLTCTALDSSTVTKIL
jgi:hypothetical protein